MIRITGGKYLSRKLLTPETDATKPTMDRVRAGVFSALQGDIQGSNVLDLFAGSGSYGFESLSRGAKEATFVENGPFALKALQSNVKTLGVESEIKISPTDYLSFIHKCAEQFDIIFVDPPYKMFDYQEIVNNLLNNDLLTTDGIIVLESEDDLSIDESPFSKVKKYKYGLAKIYILRK